MKFFRTYFILSMAFAAMLMPCCTPQEIIAPESEITLSVGEYPLFNETKAIGVPDPGKTEWKNGDMLYVVLQTAENPMAARYRVNRTSGSWTGFEQYVDGSYSPASSIVVPGTCRALVFYAPAYEFSQKAVLSLSDGKSAGLDEFLQWTSGSEYNITGATVLKVGFVKDYSRVRAVTESNYSTKLKAAGFVPAGYGTKSLKDTEKLIAKADANGNAFYYGSWPKGTYFDVTAYNVKGEYEFNNAFPDRPASVNGTSYALSCKDTGEYTTIAELSAMATSKGKSFNVKLKNAVVSYNIGKYAHLEDGSGAILVFLNNHGLEAGQSITGNISGTVKLYNSCPQITAMNYSSATVTTGAYIPCTEMTIAQLLNDFKANLHRRILLKDVSVDQGITTGSSSKRTGQISQNGSKITIYGTNSSSPAVIDAGLEGDLIAFPSYYNSTKQLSVYEDEHFTESTGGEPEDTPFTRLTVKGFYSNTGSDNPSAVMVYVEGSDQFSFGVSPGSSFYHQFNIENGTYCMVNLGVASYKIGSELQITTSLNGVEEQHSVTVVNKNSSAAWLEDKQNGTGYIIAWK